MIKEIPATVDAYIAGFPDDVQAVLSTIRATVKAAAPEAEETIAYAMPTYKLHGNLVHFAAFRNHIGFYPAPSGVASFKDELAVYKGAKGSVQFPLHQPMPLSLIQKIVKYRVQENKEKAKTKKQRV